MDNNDMMKEFNETFGNRPEPVVEPYKATQNQGMVNNVNNSNNVNFLNNNGVSNVNFVSQNSEINMVPEVNNSPVVENNNINQQLNNNINQQLNNNINQQLNNNINQQLYDTTSSINDVVVEKKTKKATLKINPELKTVIILALILLIAMFFIPMIFDWIDNLKLKF